MVVKVGSAAIAGERGVRTDRVEQIAGVIAQARSEGMSVVVVSSGSIACGVAALGLGAMPAAIVERQAAAAVGQPMLAMAWAHAFEKHSTVAAQVLLTADDLDHRGRFLNARRTIETLLEHGAVPVINENDSVSFEEIRFGDNDRLAALVATLIDAHGLVMISVAEGLQDADGKRVERVDDLAWAKSLVRDETSSVGSGGMLSKIEAAEIASRHGIETALIGPEDADGQLRAVRGEPAGTVFCAGTRATGGRKSWIGFSSRARGTLRIDAGAVRALRERGASLLPKGIVGVDGRFEAGAAVEIVGEDGSGVGRGLCSYSASEVARIAGRDTGEIETVLGYRYSDEVVHRDDMMLEVPR